MRSYSAISMSVTRMAFCSTPAEFTARIDTEITRWAEVIRRGNIRVD